MNRAQSTLSSLEKLPQECLMQILDQLEPSDAASAGATSQSLQMPSEESLYRQVNLDWTRPPLKRVLSLFCVVNERPDLAMHIRHVRMISSRLEYPAEDQTEKWYPPPVDGNWELLAASFQSEVHAAKEIVSRAQFPSPERWMQALDQGDPYAFVAITLSQLHNLRSLRLDYTFVWQSGFPGLMIRHALLSAPPDTLSKFAELSLVEYGLNVPCSRVSQGNPSDCIYPEAFPSCDPDQSAGWFYLPSLQSLEIWLQRFQGVDLSKMGHLAKLERLVIMESYIDEDEVRGLLSLLSSIQSLHLGLVYPSQDEAANWEIESPRPPLRKQMKGALLEGLMSIKGTVQTLSISIELCPINLGSQWYEKDFGDIEQALLPFRGFLKQYLHLETAELPAVLLFGWVHDDAPNLDTLLPSTLQSLAIRENLSCVARDISVIEDGSPGETYEWELDAVARAIQRFLPSARDSTPLLNKIIIRDFAMDSRGHIAEEDTLAARSLCQDLGLDMDIAISPDALPAGLRTASRALDEYSTSWRSKSPIIADSPFC
ncbi:hypothetical protein N7509_007723 [Penicillium cosmopolitanum]|uniref:F-box domain-containing protein n=1 Tax=Penicillium cosmopolitanum TaxID=1131564 RepID=A0A9W9VZG7_9EURO|nr:uncharacterized protein N7509_007723 [Penicillium cosmopolitanum]KAJ5392233.1 hypothetical protein N7509_007723 [Penicillium cosmopolitanum]